MELKGNKMFNLKKAQTESVKNQELMLEGTRERKHSLDGKTTSTHEEQLKDVRKDKDLDTTTEDQLDEVRQADVTEGRLTEGQLEHHTPPEGYVPNRNANDNLQMLPLDALNAAQEAEHIRAFNEFSEPSRDTAFWDKALGVQLEDKRTKQPNQVPESGSQLQNSEGRLSNLKVEDMGKHNALKEMVMASLKDADAMLYFIFHKAATEKRELNAEEAALVAGITKDK